MLKDITLGQYFPGDSAIHRMDPRMKLILTIVYIVGVFMVSNLPGYVLALALGMLSDLVGAVGPTGERPLVVHTDGGSVYMTDEWRGACEAGHVTRSMSRKSRSPDNARAESFFGTLKSDFFEGVDWTGVTFGEFRRRLDAYIEWYRGGKLKRSLGWRTIEQYRRDLGYAA